MKAHQSYWKGTKSYDAAQRYAIAATLKGDALLNSLMNMHLRPRTTPGHVQNRNRVVPRAVISWPAATAKHYEKTTIEVLNFMILGIFVVFSWRRMQCNNINVLFRATDSRVVR